jgi:5-methyltetrahydrofolate--homocysteine methyltransferase
MDTTEDLLDELYEAIIAGQRDKVPALVNQILDRRVPPEVILNDSMIPAMDIVGERFEDGLYFVPEMLVAAHSMQAGLNILRPLLAETDVQPIAKIAIGTVRGDIHDIGKNLVTMMLEGAGFEVLDLGVNVPPERFIESVESGAQIIGMSALLTTTMVNMQVVLNCLKEAGLRERVKVVIGGAPITQEYAELIGADGYAEDASQAVNVAKRLLGLN